RLLKKRPSGPMAQGMSETSAARSGPTVVAAADRSGDGPGVVDLEDNGWAGRWDRLTRLASARDGSDTPELVSLLDLDRVAAFRPAILAIRWGTTAVSVALAADGYEAYEGNRAAVVAWGVVIVLYTVLRTGRPIRYTGDIRGLVSVLAEVALLVAAVSTTGYWESPYVFSLLTAIIVAGFARGFAF